MLPDLHISLTSVYELNSYNKHQYTLMDGNLNL